MKTTIEEGIPAPAVRSYRRRVTVEMKGLQPGQSVVVDRLTAMCLRDYGRRHEWEVVTQRVDGKGLEVGEAVRVWRVS